MLRQIYCFQKVIDIFKSAANDLEFEAKQKRGELAKKELTKQQPRKTGPGSGRGSLPGREEDKKWHRLGYKSVQEMKDDQFIVNHPEAVEE